MAANTLGKPDQLRTSEPSISSSALCQADVADASDPHNLMYSNVLKSVRVEGQWMQDDYLELPFSEPGSLGVLPHLS